MSERVNHLDVVAIRKAAMEGWEPYRYERIASDASLITGGIPHILKSGPRKGQKTWRGKGSNVVVTDAELEAEKSRFEAETGKCHSCSGTGQVFASWHFEHGTTYRQCGRCSGSGDKP